MLPTLIHYESVRRSNLTPGIDGLGIPSKIKKVTMNNNEQQ
jgi:hypothetical protein